MKRRNPCQWNRLREDRERTSSTGNGGSGDKSKAGHRAVEPHHRPAGRSGNSATRKRSWRTRGWPIVSEKRPPRSPEPGTMVALISGNLRGRWHHQAWLTSDRLYSSAPWPFQRLPAHS